MLSYKPITPSQRHLCLVNKKHLERNIFLNSLFVKKNQSIGRDNKGHITVYHKERGHKKLYRLVDFFFLKDIPYVIESIEYDPNRSGFINLVFYKNGIYSFILATNNSFIGNVYMCSMTFFEFLKTGNRSLFMNLPIGSIVHNIATTYNDKAKYLRSAGTFGTLLKKENNVALVKLPSSKHSTDVNKGFLYCSLFGFGTLGKTSNLMHRNINIGKAGRSRWLGIRPTVRGVAMNPVDHPHGGGEGKKSKKASPTNKWGSVIKHSRKLKRKKN
jgi:large subunit ribosomal protein L2